MPIATKNLHASVGEYQRLYLYKIFIEQVPSVILAKFPQALSYQANVDLYNDKAIFPDRKTEKIKINWGGEFFYIPGVEASTKESEFTFYDDEPEWTQDFWEALKDLTGNEENQAGVYSTQSKFNIGIAKVSVDKETITNYKRLIGVRVYEVNPGELSKSGTEVSKTGIGIAWDRSTTDKTKRGKTI